MLLFFCGYCRIVINLDDCSYKVFSNLDNIIDFLDLSMIGNFENYVLKIFLFE